MFTNAVSFTCYAKSGNAWLLCGFTVGFGLPLHEHVSPQHVLKSTLFPIWNASNHTWYWSTRSSDMGAMNIAPHNKTELFDIDNMMMFVTSSLRQAQLPLCHGSL